VPNAQQTKFVKLEGEFVAAGVYSVLPGETLRQLLTRAGGFTPDAFLFASEFTRESVRRLQRQRLLEYADALESEITADTSASAAAAVTDRDAVAAQSSAAQARAALNRLRLAQPTGRIVLQLSPDSKNISSIQDMPLEDGDRFIVPKVPSSITVEGQVYSANAFVYQPGKRVKDYLHLAGGPDRVADQKREFILRADGSVLSHQYATSRQFGDFNRIEVLPGDTVVVPPKIERGALLRELVSISTILQGFGIGAAAIEVLR
jgi:polysaccharide biosynthesis/export protein